MEDSPKHIELLCPANLRMRPLIQNTSPETLFANTTVNPTKFHPEKVKWQKPIRIKKFYWICDMIINGTASGFCDKEGFVYFQSSALEKVIGSAYSRTCRIILENLGVVECHFKRQLGFCGLWIRFKEPYRTQPSNKSIWKR